MDMDMATPTPTGNGAPAGNEWLRQSLTNDDFLDAAGLEFRQLQLLTCEIHTEKFRFIIIVRFNLKRNPSSVP